MKSVILRAVRYQLAGSVNRYLRLPAVLSINPILFILRISSVVDVAIRPLVFMTPALAKILSGPKSEYMW